MEFIERLIDLEVQVYPPHTKFKKIQDRLQAFKAKLTQKYSSRILSLRPLIDGEVGQHELTNRMQTLTNILFNNLYFREYKNAPPGEKKLVYIDSVKKFSNKIMYELVKNIYQHAGVKKSNGIVSSGFACAQIYPLNQIRHERLPRHLVESVLQYLSKDNKQKKVQTLGITINDWGVGLINRVREAQKLKAVKNQRYEQLELFSNNDLFEKIKNYFS